jgi:hypothetical protein
VGDIVLGAVDVYWQGYGIFMGVIILLANIIWKLFAAP